MAARNYQPTLRAILHRLNVFVGRYRALIDAGLTSEQAIVFAALMDKVDEMIAMLGTGGGV